MLANHLARIRKAITSGNNHPGTKNVKTLSNVGQFITNRHVSVPFLGEAFLTQDGTRGRTFFDWLPEHRSLGLWAGSYHLTLDLPRWDRDAREVGRHLSCLGRRLRWVAFMVMHRKETAKVIAAERDLEDLEARGA